MDVEHREGESCRGSLLLVPVAALFVAMMGAGARACARRRHRSRHHEGPCGPGKCHHPRHHEGHEGHEGHDEMAHGREHGPATLETDPFDILARRFANGEMDEDEFRRRRSVLTEFTH